MKKILKLASIFFCSVPLAHEIEFVNSGMNYDPNRDRMDIRGHWELVSGPGDSLMYPEEHSIRIVCEFSENQCLEVAAVIYKPGDNPYFKNEKLYPWYRKFSVVKHGDDGMTAEITGRAGSFVLEVDYKSESICMTSSQTLENTDGSKPSPSKWCLEL